MNNKISKATHVRLSTQLQALQKEMLDVTLPELERAREFSNNEDNDEMMYVRHLQSGYESRIDELEKFLKDAEVIERVNFIGKVDYGTDVHIRNVETDVTRWIRIVGERESVNRSEISYKSPFGKALMDRSAGEEVEINTPNGAQYWEILEVKVSSAFSNISRAES